MAGAQKAISALVASGTLASGDIVALVISGTTKKMTASNLKTQLFGLAQTDPLSVGALTAVGNSTITGTLSGITTFTATTVNTTNLGTIASLAVSATSVVAATLNRTEAAALRSYVTLQRASSTKAAIGLDASDQLVLLDSTAAIANLTMTDAGAATLRSNLRVNGTIGIGNAAQVNQGLFINATVGSVGAYGIRNEPTFDATSSNSAFGMWAGVKTAAASFTLPVTYGIYIAPPVIGGGSAVTTNHGIYVDTQSGPTTNYAIRTIGTALSVFGGLVSVGGNLVLTTAAGKVIPGATSLSFRNNADGADNLLISDAGVVTVRSNLVMATAVSKIIPGATSISLRNNADSADNFIVTDAGNVTIRGTTTFSGSVGSLLLSSTLTFSSAASKLIPGATSFAIRDNADSVNQILFDASGITLAKKLLTTASLVGGSGLNIPSGTAPTSPNDGDMWYDGTNVKFRVGGTSKTFTLT